MSPEIAGTLLLLASLVGAHFASLILHELGHLACAYAIGWRPLSMFIGHGKSWAKLQLGDLRISLGSHFMSGSVRAVATAPAFFRTKILLFAAAGPVVTGLVAVVLFWWVADSNHLVHFPALMPAAVIGLALQGLILLMTLIPRTIHLDGEPTATDGLLMWRAISWKKEDAEMLCFGHLLSQVTWLRRHGQEDDARKLIGEWKGLSTRTKREIQVFKIRWLLEEELETAALAEWDRLLLIDESDAAARASLLDALACVPLFAEFPILLPRSLSAIEEAIELCPDCITLRGTLGSLLVEVGRVEEGAHWLRKVMLESESTNDVAICAYYLALVEFKSGAKEEAKRQYDNAKAKYPACVAATHVGKSMSSPTGGLI